MSKVNIIMRQSGRNHDMTRDGSIQGEEVFILLPNPLVKRCQRIDRQISTDSQTDKQSQTETQTQVDTAMES